MQTVVAQTLHTFQTILVVRSKTTKQYGRAGRGERQHHAEHDAKGTPLVVDPQLILQVVSQLRMPHLHVAGQHALDQLSSCHRPRRLPHKVLRKVVPYSMPARPQGHLRLEGMSALPLGTAHGPDSGPVRHWLHLDEFESGDTRNAHAREQRAASSAAKPAGESVMMLASR